MNSLVTYPEGVNQASNATYFVVQRLSNIMDIIIPFFDKYPLVGVKVKDF
jgi:hypothetical protein